MANDMFAGMFGQPSGQPLPPRLARILINPTGPGKPTKRYTRGAVFILDLDDVPGIATRSAAPPGWVIVYTISTLAARLGGRFDLDAFLHAATWNEEAGRVEMHLVSARDQTVRIDDLALDVPFRAGETIHTENSYKYSLEEIDALAATAGFRVERRWLDAGGRFSLQLLRPRT